MTPTSGISFGNTSFGASSSAAAAEHSQAMRALQTCVEQLQRLITLDLLTRAGANLSTSASGKRVAATGTTGTGTELYRNDTNRMVAVIVRDRGGTAQTLFASKNSNMDVADGFSTSGTTGVTTETDPFLVRPNEAVYARMSSSAVMVDVAILDLASLDK